MLRQVHPNTLRSLQHKQAEDLLAKCLDFIVDYDTLKWEFASNKSSTYGKLFDEITGKDNYLLAMLRDNICYLVDTTKEALERRTDASHSGVIKDLTRQLDWMIKTAIQLRIQLEGENGHTYRDGSPDYKGYCLNEFDFST
jgi:hypothetical protein